MIVYGPSGMGKTRLVEELCDAAGPTGRFDEVLLHTIYRTGWTAALAQLKKHIHQVPTNATLDELEDVLIAHATRISTLLVLDNVEETNVAEVGAFVERWLSGDHRSALVLTAQDQVRAALPRDGRAAVRLSGARGDTVGFIEHLQDHPEFGVYTHFWETYLSAILGDA